MDLKSLKTTFHRGIYTNGQEMDYDYIRLAKKTNLTFDERFLRREFRPKWYETPFKEIRFTFPGERSRDKEILQPISVTELDLRSYIELLKNKIKDYFRKMLVPEEKYIVMHSAGYDSRILSACLMELRGEIETRNIHFRCHQPECEGFFKIMEMEGWPKDQYSCYPGKEKNYYEVGGTLNGFQNYNQAMRFWGDIVKDEKEWIAIGGFGANEYFKYVGKNLIRKNKRTNCEQLDMLLDNYPDEGQWEGLWMRNFKDVYLPYLGYEFMKEAFRVKKEWCKFNGETDLFRIAVSKSFNIGIENIAHGKHHYIWNLNEDYLNKRYYSSQFYKDYPLKGLNFIKGMYKFDAKIWGFMTVYDEIRNS